VALSLACQELMITGYGPAVVARQVLGVGPFPLIPPAWSSAARAVRSGFAEPGAGHASCGARGRWAKNRPFVLCAETAGPQDGQGCSGSCHCTGTAPTGEKAKDSQVDAELLMRGLLWAADGPAQGQPGAGGSSLLVWLPFIVIGAMFYFLLIRPQRREQIGWSPWAGSTAW